MKHSHLGYPLLFSHGLVMNFDKTNFLVSASSHKLGLVPPWVSLSAILITVYFALQFLALWFYMPHYKNCTNIDFSVVVKQTNVNYFLSTN